MKKLLFTLMVVFAMSGITAAQNAALKFNPVYLALGGANVGIEFAVAPQWTLGIDGAGVIFNPWKNADSKIYANGWITTVEGRYYICDVFEGNHFGLYASFGRFGTMTSQNKLFSSWFMGGSQPNGVTDVVTTMAGLSYGYSFWLSNRLGLDCYIGGGIAFVAFDTGAGRQHETHFTLSRVGIALSYKF